MAAQTSQLIVRLIDQVSGPARAASAAVRNLVTGATARLDRALDANAKALDKARNSMLDATAGALALGAALGRPIGVASEFETLMTDIGLKVDATDDALKALGDRFKTLSGQLGQSTTAIAKGFDTLVGAGLNQDVALNALSPITKLAAAYGGTIEDASKASFALISNMKVPVDQLGKALDGMAASGKMGSFEVRDMAEELAGLTPAAATLGITGVRGLASLTSMLQVARKGAASSSEAANNVANLLQKVVSPDAVKRFKAQNIDIRAELQKTAEKGGDVFERIAELVDQATQGDTAKISDFFQDAQVQRALIPLLQNKAEFRRIRDEALRADGTVERDFAKRMETSASAMARFSASIERLQLALGGALLPAVDAVLAKLAPMVDAFTGFVSANPEVVSAIAQIATAFVGLTVGLAVARYAFLLFQRGALLAIRGVTVALGPVGLALGAVAAAGVWISRNWQGLTELVSGFVGAIRDNFPSLGPIFDTLGQWVSKIVGFFNDLLGPVRMTASEWRALGTAMGQSIAGLVNDIAALPGKIVAVFAALPGEMYAIGAQIIQRLLDGLMAKGEELVSYLTELASRAASAIAGLGIGSMQPAGMEPAGKSFGRGPQPPARKATGGPVAAGGSFWVGEKGPEIFRPNVNGSITPNSAIGGSTNVSIPVHIVIHAQDSVEGTRRAVASIRDEIARAFRGIQADAGLSLA